ncbi:hypothetical protein QQX98_000946 [Neonectria punicea]|uniref:Uncharacterized protein n=1 Tax=Neonectria punicea TaxID=979145 RepID=A0ABR1HQP9_9HYPO
MVPGHGKVEHWMWDPMPATGVDDIAILSIQCTPVGKNLFGQVGDGSIFLKGHVRTATIQLSDGLHDPSSGESIGGVNLDEGPSQSSTGGFFTASSWLSSST